MKTRRKSKAAAAAEHDAEGDAAEGNATQSFTLPDDLDIEALKNLLPDAELTSASPDTVAALCRVILAQAADVEAAQHELEEARAEAERKEVELDQALQDRERVNNELQAKSDAFQAEIAQVKAESEQLARSNVQLQAQVTTLTSSQSTSSTEADALKRHVEDIEREKRDLMGVVSRLKEDSTQRDEEVQTLRVNLKQARQEHQELESQSRTLRSSETSTNFKIETLSQQLQLSQSEVERLSAELTSKSEEYTKHRRTAHAELVQLQASHDALTQTHASDAASLKALQAAHTAQAHQLAQALTRVQDLQGRIAEQDASYAAEASGLKRLVTMMEEREKTAKDIVDNIEREWATVGERAERREAVLREATEREKRAREEAEKRVEQLEAVMERMDRGELPVPGHSPAPGTPGRGQDTVAQGMISLSPTVAMASRVQRSGKTFTEVYADYVQLQDDFARKSAECEHLDRTLSAVLAQIEERAPILSQQRAEYERLQSEAAQLASQLAQTLADRDAQATLARENSQKLSKSARENDLLQKQLEDLGRQVRTLLKEVGRQTDLSLPSDEELERIPPREGGATADSVITDHLVLFRSIDELQQQNQKLLRVTRELGDKMESEERDYRAAMEREQAEAVREASEVIADLQSQLERQKSGSNATIQAYMKERDALKGMLTRYERGDITTNSSNGPIAANGFHDSVAPPDLAREHAELQDQFDAYRMEIGIDSSRVREDLIATQRELGQVGAALAKANARTEFMMEQKRILTDQLAMRTDELEKLSKRNAQLSDQHTRSEMEAHRLSEDLIVAQGNLERLRNECANLRAEKRITDSVQARLVEENKSLALERSKLSDLMTNVQKMHNDLERSGDNDRRRLETQLQMLEAQSQDLKAQLSQERDSLRHLSLQKDIETKELRDRLDKTTEESAKTREQLVGSETNRTHFEERLRTATAQLQGLEEKLAVYERRTTSVTGIASTADPNLSREQQLEADIADLTSKLKVTEVEVVNARMQAQQWKDIAETHETALTNTAATHDTFRASAEAEIAKHEAHIKALSEELQSVKKDRKDLADKLGELKQAYERDRAAWYIEKRELEGTIFDMTNLNKDSESDRSAREAATREQEERVKVAEERYSKELVAHAETVKSNNDLKQRLASAEATAKSCQTAAQTADAKLVTSEQSWKQQKDALEKELSSVRERNAEISKDNANLLQHVETITVQASRIRQVSDGTVPADAAADISGDEDTKLSELRSVVSYLRKEKEIVDLQLELSKQETSRLKIQIENLSQSLNETRETLSQERQRAADAASSDTQTAELIEQINTANILRESNATLRAESAANGQRARELEEKLNRLSAELEPVKEQARVAQAEVAALTEQNRAYQEQSAKWQERNQQLLSKYDRIDPEEFQKMNDEVQQLKTHIEELEQEQKDADALKSTLQQQVSARDRALMEWKERQTNRERDFRTQMGNVNAEKSRLSSQLSELQAKLHAATQAQGTANSEASQELNRQLDVLREEKASLEKTLAAEAQEKTRMTAELANKEISFVSIQMERDALAAEKETWSKTATIVSSSEGSSNEELARITTELSKARDEAIERAKAAATEQAKLVEETKSLKLSNEKHLNKIRELMKARHGDEEKYRAQTKTAVEAAIEQARNESGDSASIMGSAKQHADELRALEERLKAEHSAQLKAALESAGKATPNASQVASDDSVKAAIAAKEAELQEQHKAELEAATESGRKEINMKLKLKDSQLTRAMAKLKEAESQVAALRKQGLIPEDSSTKPSPVTPQSSSNGAAAPTVAAATQSTPTPAGNTSLPRKPSINVPPGTSGTAPKAASTTTPTRGRGAARGGAPSTKGRGGAPAATAAAATSNTAASPSGLSIAGAATKRGRESEGDSGPDSLAKRIKAAPAGNSPSGRPVTLQRNRVPPPASDPPS